MKVQVGSYLDTTKLC